jgi:hypothetical protein
VRLRPSVPESRQGCHGTGRPLPADDQAAVSNMQRDDGEARFVHDGEGNDRMTLIDGILAAVGAVLCFGCAVSCHRSGRP